MIEARASRLRWAALALWVLFAWVIVQNAWLADDAFITFRTVDNWAHGLGLRWNVAERVQTFTNPLWMMLLAAARVVTGEVVLTSLALNGLLSLSALGLLLWTARRRWPVALALAVGALTSRALVDYSTSGLENALGHVLVVTFVVFATRAPRARLLELSLLASLLALHRLDTALLAVPTLLWRVGQERSARAGGAVLLGLSPLLLWESFSVLYYGFLFPNTAYAKLGSGIGSTELFGQGLRYLRNSLRFDPVTLPMIALGIFWGWRGGAPGRALVSGLALCLLYVVGVGGDFMTGRFLSTPLAAALAMWAVQAPRVPVRMAWAAAGLASLTVALLGHSPVRTGPHHYDAIAREDLADPAKIADERGFYFPATNPLWAWATPFPDHPWANWGRSFRDTGQVGYVLGSEMGMKGFYAGPRLHMIDRYGLTDPLVARLPAVNREDWRIGHFRRRLPEGYYDSRRTGSRQIEDPEVQEYVDHLTLITQGPLSDRRRLATIVKMNLGRYDHLLDAAR